MTDKATEASNATRANTPLALKLTEGLGPLPPYLYGSECGPLERVWTERDMREYAASAVATAAWKARQSEVDMLRNALAELVACKDIKERLAKCWPDDPEAPELQREYSTRKGAAWAAARAVLGGPNVRAKRRPALK